MTRDLSRPQFLRALAREGFAEASIGTPFAGLWYVDTSGETSASIHYGAVIDRQRYRILYRATLAHLIRRRQTEVRNAAAKVAGGPPRV